MWASFIVTILLSFHELDTILLWSLGHQDDCMSLAGNTYQTILPVYLKKKDIVSHIPGECGSKLELAF